MPYSFVEDCFLIVGAVKITPAHDFNDFDVGKRHALQALSVIDENGHLTQACGQFAGLPRFEARKVITEELRKIGLLRGRQDHTMVVPICRFGYFSML